MTGLTSTQSSTEKQTDQVTEQSHTQAQPSPLAGPEAGIMALHDAAGNRAVSQLIQTASDQPNLSQPQLTIGQSGDRYEQEADRVADSVVGMSNPQATTQNKPALTKLPQTEQVHDTSSVSLQQQPVEANEAPSQDKDETSVTQAASPNLTRRVQTMQGKGQPLSTAERDFFEPRIGGDFSKVRVHTGSQASAMADEVRARAFTVGSDIVFGSGEYSPESEAGSRLMAHELAHVVQQRGGASDGISGSAVLQRAPESEGFPTDEARPDKRKFSREFLFPPTASGLKFEVMISYIVDKKGASKEQSGIDLASTEQNFVRSSKGLSAELKATLLQVKDPGEISELLGGVKPKFSLIEIEGKTTKDKPGAPLEGTGPKLSFEFDAFRIISALPISEAIRDDIKALQKSGKGQLIVELSVSRDLASTARTVGKLVEKLGRKDKRKLKELARVNRRAERQLAKLMDETLEMDALEKRIARQAKALDKIPRGELMELAMRHQDVEVPDPKEARKEARRLKRQLNRLHNRASRRNQVVRELFEKSRRLAMELDSTAGRQLARILGPVFKRLARVMGKYLIPGANILFAALDVLEVVRLTYLLATGKAEFGFPTGAEPEKPGDRPSETGTGGGSSTEEGGTSGTAEQGTGGGGEGELEEGTTGIESDQGSGMPGGGTDGGGTTGDGAAGGTTEPGGEALQPVMEKLDETATGPGQAPDGTAAETEGPSGAGAGTDTKAGESAAAEGAKPNKASGTGVGAEGKSSDSGTGSAKGKDGQGESQKKGRKNKKKGRSGKNELGGLPTTSEDKSLVHTETIEEVHDLNIEIRSLDVNRDKPGRRLRRKIFYKLNDEIIDSKKRTWFEVISVNPVKEGETEDEEVFEMKLISRNEDRITLSEAKGLFVDPGTEITATLIEPKKKRTKKRRK